MSCVLRGRRLSSAAGLLYSNCTIKSWPPLIRSANNIEVRPRCTCYVELSASRPTRESFRDPDVATQIALKSLAKCVLELNDEIADLDELTLEAGEGVSRITTRTLRHGSREHWGVPGSCRSQLRTPWFRGELCNDVWSMPHPQIFG